MSNYRDCYFDNRGPFNEFEGFYSIVNCQLAMMKDYQRNEGLFKAIKKYCKGKRVVDFGAGTGLLGVYALMNGAKEVWFVEREVNLHPIIENLARINGDFDNNVDYHICVNASQIPDQKDYFEVCISECVGDSGIEDTMTYEFGKITRKHPNSICIPDRIEYFWSSVYVDEVEKEIKYMKDFPINYVDLFGKDESPFCPMNVMRGCSLRGYHNIIENKISTLDLKNYPTEPYVDMRFSLNNSSIEQEHNFIVLHWKCFTEDLEILNNSPQRHKDSYNHWLQFGFRDEGFKGDYSLYTNVHTGLVNLLKYIDENDNKIIQGLNFKYK
jgi:hypothetical protein